MIANTAIPPAAPPLALEQVVPDHHPHIGDAAAQRFVLSAYLELTKPRIVFMVLLTTGVGFWLGARLGGHPLTLAATLLGTALVAGGASVWNQVIERSRDARMRRTARRPLPLGEISPRAASLFGTAITAAGLAVLAGVHPIAALVALLTFVLYIAVYTPLKLVTTLNTAIGAIPGALPPVIGWAAATGRIGLEAWVLFLIVFLWQFPHFLAIAWLHREDYARGGYRMLPLVDPDGSITARQALAFALTLIPAGLMPALIGLAGPWYYLGALVLGFYYVDASFRFWAHVGDASARRLMRASFLYLPLVLLLLILNPLPA
jgi:protoheme IX farnesyltransferase